MQRTALCIIAAFSLSACAWRHVEIEGPIPRAEIPSVIKRFDAFGKFLEEEQKRGNRVPLSAVRENPWNFDFLVDIPFLHENFESTREDDQKLHSGRYLEGYAAFREWWPNFDTPRELKIGGHTLKAEDYEHLRYYEVDFSYNATYGHPLHEEMVRPAERIIKILDRLKFIAFSDGDEIYILDARRAKIVDALQWAKYESFFGRIGRYFVDIIKAVIGN